MRLAVALSFFLLTGLHGAGAWAAGVQSAPEAGKHAGTPASLLPAVQSPVAGGPTAAPALLSAALTAPPSGDGQPVAHGPAVQVSTPVSAQISATMSGQLTEFPFRDGDRFHVGDVLARFQCGQQKATLAHARAEHIKRKGLLEVQNRMKALGQWSVSDLQSAAADAQAAEADLEMATAVVAQCTIVAPFNGRVSNVLVHNYQYLSPGTPMLDILDDSSLELSMIVSSMELRQLRPDTPFKVWIHETGRTYDAVVTRLSGKVDPVSKTIKVYGRLVQPAPDLLPGMTGDAVLKN
ncbi:efflux RND transporter periplasmic adaptor subunit [Gluconacetobacter aggeris]|uniref:Efflux RND transporter periplasmic adaptor subunit n=1 Tax=Gluconacetobacter aggeris TaxID=1286186 RepID=A0A7W4NY33_9PROT|nr:efflux RND transporter periplasmic adaptor subunit [Gluconacetobacter aggeris]MBB2170159.1 efflux RND transporter periplasmic adaptor subunit [Gluconacetobacter aggeris]